MNVVYAATRNLYKPLKGAIQSLLDHNENVKVYVLAEDDKLPFEIPCDHEIINVSGQTYFKPTSPNIHTQFTYMSMCRVCTPDLIKDDRVIQLDVDTIVCDSLEPIWEVDLSGKWVGWVREVLGTWKPFGETYYNFGVAVLNLAQMREDGFVEKMVEELNTKYYLYIDQDIMNRYAVPDKCVEIPMRYNECFCCGYTENPAVVHFAGFPDWYENWLLYRYEYVKKYKDKKS